jgi:hypothetical protein
MDEPVIETTTVTSSAPVHAHVPAVKPEPKPVTTPKHAPEPHTIAGAEQAKANALTNPPVPAVKPDPALTPKKASEYFDEFFSAVKNYLKEPGQGDPPNLVLRNLDLGQYQRVVHESMDSTNQQWALVAAYAAMAYASFEEAKRIAAVKVQIDFKAEQEAKAEKKAADAKAAKA